MLSPRTKKTDEYRSSPSENALIVILCRYKDLTQENQELSKDINQLEQLLSSHVSTKRDRPKQEQGYVCGLIIIHVKMT